MSSTENDYRDLLLLLIDNVHMGVSNDDIVVETQRFPAPVRLRVTLGRLLDRDDSEQERDDDSEQDEKCLHAHVCTVDCRPNRHIAFLGRRATDEAIARAEAAEQALNEVASDHEDELALRLAAEQRVAELEAAVLALVEEKERKPYGSQMIVPAELRTVVSDVGLKE